MDPIKRATIYFDADLHQALRLKAAASDSSISEIVNEATRLALAEDIEDLEAIRSRAREPSISFESFVKQMRRRGRL